MSLTFVAAAAGVLIVWLDEHSYKITARLVAAVLVTAIIGWQLLLIDWR